jgi:hypothetical protein
MSCNRNKIITLVKDMRAHIFQMRYNNSLLQYYRDIADDKHWPNKACSDITISNCVINCQIQIKNSTNANNYSVSQAWIRDLTSSRLTILSTGYS